MERSDTADLAKAIISENHLSHKITVIKKEMEQLTLKDISMVDIIISEWMGFCLLYESMLDSVLWAKNNFLKEGGKMFPEQASLWIAGFDDSEWKPYADSYWDNNEYGIKMSCIKDYKDRFLMVDQVPKNIIITDKCKVFEVNTLTCSVDDLEFSNSYSLRVLNEEDCKLYGYVIWFEVTFPTEDGEDIVLSTSPEHDFTHWKHQLIYFSREQQKNSVFQDDSITGSFAIRKNPRDRRDIQLKVSVNK